MGLFVLTIIATILIAVIVIVIGGLLITSIGDNDATSWFTALLIEVLLIGIVIVMILGSINIYGNIDKQKTESKPSIGQLINHSPSLIKHCSSRLDKCFDRWQKTTEKLLECKYPNKVETEQPKGRQK